MIAQRPSVVGNPWEDFPFVKFSVGIVEEKIAISSYSIKSKYFGLCGLFLFRVWIVMDSSARFSGLQILNLQSNFHTGAIVTFRVSGFETPISKFV